MIGVDTNILVRFLVGDDTNQSQKVYQIFKKAESENSQLYVTILVVLELIWVLESAYDIKRDELLECLSQLILMPIFDFQNLSAIQKFIQIAQVTNFDLSDLLIAYVSEDGGCKQVLTFDKKASKHKLFKLI